MGDPCVQSPMDRRWLACGSFGTSRLFKTTGVNGPPYDPTRKPNAILSEAELYPYSDSIAAGLEFEYININNSKKSGVVFECIRSSNHKEFPEYAYKLKSKDNSCLVPHVYRTRWTDGGLPPAHSGRAVCSRPLHGQKVVGL
jgi:hypothetical protein